MAFCTKFLADNTTIYYTASKTFFPSPSHLMPAHSYNPLIHSLVIEKLSLI